MKTIFKNENKHLVACFMPETDTERAIIQHLLEAGYVAKINSQYVVTITETNIDLEQEMYKKIIAIVSDYGNSFNEIIESVATIIDQTHSYSQIISDDKTTNLAQQLSEITEAIKKDVIDEYIRLQIIKHNDRPDAHSSKLNWGLINTFEDLQRILDNGEYGIYSCGIGWNVWNYDDEFLFRINDGGESTLTYLPAVNGVKIDNAIPFELGIAPHANNVSFYFTQTPQTAENSFVNVYADRFESYGDALSNFEELKEIAKDDDILHILTSGAVNITINGEVVAIPKAGEWTFSRPKGSVISALGYNNIVGIYRYDGTITCAIKSRSDIVFINNTTIEVGDMLWFYGCENLESMHNTKIACRKNVISLYGLFNNTRLQVAPYMANTAANKDLDSMYSSCENLTSVPLIDTSNVTSFKQLFDNCVNLSSAPLYDTSKATTIQNMFTACHSLRTLPRYNFANVTNITTAFALMSNLVEFPAYFNFEKVVTATYAFAGEWGYYNEQKDTYSVGGLRRFPAYSFPECTTLQGAWQDQSRLFSIGKLNIPKCTNLTTAFHGCFNLTNVGGFSGLKCDLNLAHCSKLTVASLVNIFNEAANVTTLGTRSMTLGATNIAKLSDAQKAIATAKGWTLL